MPDRRPLSIGTATSIGPKPQGFTLGEVGTAPDPITLITHELMQAVSADPVGAALAILPFFPHLKSLGKPVSELDGATFKPTAPGSGLPQGMRLTNWDGPTGNVDFHAGTRKTGERFQATPGQLDELIDGGALDLAQPPQRPVFEARSKIRETLDASGKDFKKQQFERATRKPLAKPKAD